MKTGFLINNLFFSLLIFTTLQSYTPEHAHNHTHTSSHIPSLSNTELTPTNQETYEQIECTIEAITETLQRDSHTHIPGSLAPSRTRSGTVIESSNNWSGYVAVSNVNDPACNTVSAVAGSWTVPTIIASSDNSYSAFWVGIDGFTSPTVEQIGTAHDWNYGNLQNYAWFEMYPGGSYIINGFPLRHGDVISATVIYSGNGIFTMTLSNVTQRKSFTVPTSYTTLRGAIRSSAEWIVEAPYYYGILPLADFGTAHFNNCTATLNGVTQAIGKFPNIALNMITYTGSYKDKVSALASNQNSFSVVWDGQ